MTLTADRWLLSKPEGRFRLFLDRSPEVVRKGTKLRKEYMYRQLGQDASKTIDANEIVAAEH